MGTVAGAKLGQDIVDVIAYRRGTDMQYHTDLVIGFPGMYPLQHILFTAGKNRIGYGGGLRRVKTHKGCVQVGNDDSKYVLMARGEAARVSAEAEKARPGTREVGYAVADQVMNAGAEKGLGP